MKKGKRRHQEVVSSEPEETAKPLKPKEKSAPLEEKRNTRPKEKISFETWFTRARAKNSKIKPWQHKELRVFFKKHGLGDREEEEKYEKKFLQY